MTTFFLVPPTFVESPKNQTIPNGHTASFPCTALGDPRPSITWYKSHDLITSNARYHILANQTLVIYSVTAQDSGSLTCRAMNEAGTREAKAYLLVAGLAFIFLYVIVFIPDFFSNFMHCGFTLTATVVINRDNLITLSLLCCIPHHFLRDQKNY